MAKKMGKREAIAIIEDELRRQAQAGQVSSKLVEQLVTIRGWSGKAKAARANARAAIVQPPVDEVPLPDLIAQAKELDEGDTQPSPPSGQPAGQAVTMPPAGRPLAPAATRQAPEPTPPQQPPVRPEAGWTLETLMPHLVEKPSQPSSSPVPTVPPPRSVYLISDLVNDDPEPSSAGDYGYW